MRECLVSDLANVNPPLSRVPADQTVVSFISMGDVSESGGVVQLSEVPFGRVKTGFTRFQNGDILFAKITPCMENGKGAYVSHLANGVGCGSTEFHVLRAKDICCATFLYQHLQSRALRQKAELYMSGSAGQQRVPAEFFRRLRISAPSFALQEKIAAILTSLDTAIEKTESLIEKHQQIKAGLMHDLFTRGVLPDGQLRPAARTRPDLYCNTPIGRFPTDWAVCTLAALLAPVAHNMRSGPFGSALLKQELVERGIPFLGIDNIHPEEFRARFERFVDERKFQQLVRYRVRTSDVVITIMGTVGRSCVIPSSLEVAMSSKHLWTMTFDQDRVLPDLICWQLNHANWVKSWFRRATQGGIMDAIQSSTLKSLRLPVPPMAEQRRIAEIYRSLQRKLDTLRNQLDKTLLEKFGLMQSLLTGKLRVAESVPMEVLT